MYSPSRHSKREQSRTVIQGCSSSPVPQPQMKAESDLDIALWLRAIVPIQPSPPRRQLPLLRVLVGYPPRIRLGVYSPACESCRGETRRRAGWRRLSGVSGNSRGDASRYHPLVRIIARRGHRARRKDGLLRATTRRSCGQQPTPAECENPCAQRRLPCEVARRRPTAARTTAAA